MNDKIKYRIALFGGAVNTSLIEKLKLLLDGRVGEIQVQETPRTQTSFYEQWISENTPLYRSPLKQPRIHRQCVNRGK